MADPAYRRLLASENLLRRVTPILIITFIIIVLAARFMSLTADRELTLTNAKMYVALLADSAAAGVERATDGGFAPANGTDFDDVLSRALPLEATYAGRVILVTDERGRVISARGGLGNLLNQRLEEKLSLAQPLFMFGRGAGVQDILLDDEPCIAALAKIGTSGEAIMVLQSRYDLFAPWRQQLSLNAALFVAMASTLLALLYSYYVQSARARDADEMYAEAHEKVELALSRGLCGLWNWDLARGSIFWSRSMFEMLGYPPQEKMMSFGDVTGLIHPDDIDLFNMAEQAAAQKIDRVDQLFRMRHSDGHYVWLRIRTELVEHSATEKYMIGIAVDVTENHRLARKSEVASQTLKAAIESTSESFALWDANERLVLSNSKFLEFNGLSAETAKPGMSRAEISGLMQKPVSETRIPTPNSDASAPGLKVERQISDGRWIQINERRTADGGTISVGTEITVLKNHEERLKDSERQLMATVEDLKRTRKLTEEHAAELQVLSDRYRDARDKAEAAYRTKSEFMANMSHELRTPLNAIIGFSEMMQSGMFGPLGSTRYVEYVEDIHASGTFLMSVISDILETSKIEAGRLVLDRDDFDLHPLIEETVNMISIQAGKKDISVERSIDRNMSIHADQRSIKQILINLLSNATKFTDNGGHIRIRAKALKQAVQISIEDTGCGIPRAALKRIGQPFEQVQNQMSKNHSGTGLGLAIARSLAELHGGSMRIRSREGVGTIVSVRIPTAGGLTRECQPENGEVQPAEAEALPA